jgi:hypothetical protein
MINKQIVSIKYITVFQCTYYILHCFLYPFILCIFWTTDQKVTGLNPVGVTRRSALTCAFPLKKSNFEFVIIPVSVVRLNDTLS